MKRIVFIFIFFLITLILAEWAAANEVAWRLKSWIQKIRIQSTQEKWSDNYS